MEQKEVTVEVVLKNCPMISHCLSVAEALAKNNRQFWKQYRSSHQVKSRFISISIHIIMFFSTSVHVNGNLLKGIYALLEDKSFLLPTRPAQLVLKTAKLLLEWAPSHILEIECFDKDMAHLFSSCFPKQRAKKGFKGSIWQKYHMLRTSDTYISLWRRFIQTSIGVDLSPIFIQYVGHHGFKEALKNQFPVEHIYVDRAGVHNELTYQELNAVRYAAGFVPRALKKSLLKKLKQRPTANKTTQDYILCLESLISNDDDNEQQHCSSDWVNSINRGVNNMTFELFFTMECVLHTQLEYNPITWGRKLSEESLQVKMFYFVGASSAHHGTMTAAQPCWT